MNKQNKGEIAFDIWNKLPASKVEEAATTFSLRKYTDKGKEFAHIKLIWFSRIMDREMFDSVINMYGE